MLLQKLKKNRKGFTLIELIVVVAILAILAAVAVPSFIGIQQQAKDAVKLSNASQIASGVNVAMALGKADPTEDVVQAWKTYEAMKTALGADAAPVMPDADVAAAAPLVSQDASGVYVAKAGS